MGRKKKELEEEIKLVLERDIDTKSFNDTYSSVVCEIKDDNIHSLAVLKECLSKVGITLEAKRYEHNDILNFKIDFETFNKVTKRGAGRKKDYSMEKKYKKCTVSELKTKLKTMKKCDIIEELECPKATFYRILKNIELDNIAEDEDSIWLYTS